MKNLMHVLFPIIFVFLPSLNGYSQAGTLDDTFGTNGIVRYDSGEGHDNAHDIHVFDDNTMIICGNKSASGFVTSGILQKFLQNGDIDTSWGNNGIVEFQYGLDTYAFIMKVQDDGTILVSGMTNVTDLNSEFYVSKFNSDGTPDLSFNGTGTWIGSYTTFEEVAKTMAVQADGKIVLAGRTYAGSFSQLLFARLNADGTLDTGFGTNGYTEINASPQDEIINGLGFLSTGEIIGVGYGYVSSPWFTDFSKMVKLDANGNPDTDFGTDGVIIPNLFEQPSKLWDLIIINDDVIVLGEMWEDPDRPLVVAKLNQSGDTVIDFGTDGITTLNIDVVTVGLDIERFIDDKLYVCGTSGLSGINERDFLLARFNADGTLDNTFNGMGYVKTPIGPDWDEANAVTMQPDGKIVLAGFRSGISTNGDNDCILARYHNDIVLSNDEFNNKELNIYPNPVNDLLYITANEVFNAISISNILGQVVYEVEMEALDTTIDMSGYTKGTYFVRVQSGTDIITKKFIKE